MNNRIALIGNTSSTMLGFRSDLIEKLVMKQGKMIGYFIGDQQSSFYQSKRFIKVMQFAQHNGNICKVKEKETKTGLKLLITFENVKSINKALEMLERM